MGKSLGRIGVILISIPNITINLILSFIVFIDIGMKEKTVIYTFGK